MVLDQAYLLLGAQDDLFLGLTVTSLVVALSVFAAFLLWNRSLQRQAAERQAGMGGQLSDNWTNASQNRRRILLVSIATMSLITLCVVSIAAYLLYGTSFEQQRERLVETASAQARLIEAVARYDRTHSQGDVSGATAATISQIVDAHQRQSGLGDTGEFTLARLEGDEMIFLLDRRHSAPGQSLRIPFRGSELAEPMRRALSGQSGTTVATDYRGELVLAAYEPVDEIELGIVAKIDLDEIRQPFLRAGNAALGLAALLILTGSFVVVWVNAPLIKRVEDRERRLHAIVSNVVDAVFTVDAKGKILSFNQAAEDIFGYTAAEVQGRNVSTLIHDTQTDEDLDLAKLMGQRHEVLGRRKDGDIFPMDVALNPMDRGDAPTLVGIARDNTERKRAEVQLRRVNFLSDIALDLTGCAYWHVDYRDPDYYYQSERAARMLGEPLKPDGRYHLQDEWFARLVEANAQTAEATAERYQGAVEGRYEHYESTYAYKRPTDGKIIWLHAMGRVDRDDNGKIKFMYGAYQDITDRKHSEEALQEARRAAEGAKAAAEAANRAKSDFLSHMSHELRTPLNGILGYAQILQRDQGLTNRQRGNLESIVNCGDHLLALINDVLDLSKIEAGRIEVDMAPADLQALIKGVADIVSQRAKRKGIAFATDVSNEMPRGIVVDAAKLRQILVNLLGNAVKFTAAGQVTLRAGETPRGFLRFEVVDTGVGMSDEELTHIFDPFKQVEAGKAAGGTGLGLAISKRLADAMGATIEVKSIKGTGSTFTVVMPLVEAEAEDWPEPVDERSGDGANFSLAKGQEWTILIADDRDTNRDVLRGMLEPAGFRTLLATDGDEALDVLRAHDDVDLVLMDVRMPRVSGIEALQMIRQDSQLREIKVIAVTASVFPEFRRQAVDAGFDDFLAKPFRTAELMDKLKRHLGVTFDWNAAAQDTAYPETPDLESSSGDSEIVPAILTQRLREALRFKNLTAISDLAAELSADPATSKTGDKLTDLIDAFDFDGIDQLASDLENQNG